jgi:hypothetical protein
MKRDPIELGRTHTADESHAFQPGQGAVVYPDALVVPSHIVFERTFDEMSSLLKKTANFGNAGGSGQ